MTFDWPTLLPLIFAGLMGLAILIYVILDGFDLGIGILFAAAEDAEQDTMIAAIGPFWDANETWLVLAVGLLLVAFPLAHGIILTALYIPVFVLLVGLILRGVAFDFRAKVPAGSKHRWNRIFFARLAHRLAGARLYARRLCARPRCRPGRHGASARWWRSASPPPMRRWARPG